MLISGPAPSTEVRSGTVRRLDDLKDRISRLVEFFGIALTLTIEARPRPEELAARQDAR